MLQVFGELREHLCRNSRSRLLFNSNRQCVLAQRKLTFLKALSSFFVPKRLRSCPNKRITKLMLAIDDKEQKNKSDCSLPLRQAIDRVEMGQEQSDAGRETIEDSKTKIIHFLLMVPAQYVIHINSLVISRRRIRPSRTPSCRYWPNSQFILVFRLNQLQK